MVSSALKQRNEQSPGRWEPLGLHALLTSRTSLPATCDVSCLVKTKGMAMARPKIKTLTKQDVTQRVCENGQASISTMLNHGFDQ
jgi:hypothetical protein